MKYTLGVALGLAALLSGCSHTKKSSDAVADVNVTESAPSARLMEAPAMVAAPPVQDASYEEKSTAEVSADPLPIPTAVLAPARLLIYHADLRLKVASLARASAGLDSLVRRNGGYLSAATEARSDGEWRQAMTIRVLPGRFQALLAALGGLGTVEEKKLTTDDVTAQHADVAARLSTKRAVEKRYIDLLSRAHKISEVLAVEEKIGEVREEIESTESRLKALNDEVSYSTISLTCYQVLPQAVPDAPVISLAGHLVDSFYTGWTLLTSLLIGVVAIWPLLIVGGGAWWALRRWRRSVA